jgi:hypothetical protein
MKRGINLGCGKIILPGPKPEHHRLIPDAVYAEETAWDNVDRNAGEGVNIVCDLFDYPWRQQLSPIAQEMLRLGYDKLSDNTYDVAIASHIAEHIPHHIVWEGQFVHHHPEYQDGWFAFFSELWRVMKPGGVAYILAPYGFSLGGLSDPTHTRYLTPTTFNYFNAPTNGSPFEYRMGASWQMNPEVMYSPHEEGMKLIARYAALANAAAGLVGQSVLHEVDKMDWSQLMSELASNHINMIAEFCVEMTAVKPDASIRAVPEPERRSEAGPEPESVDVAGVQDSGAQGVAVSGAAG